MLPTASVLKTIPGTTALLCKPPPKSFATRTLSTLKFAGFLGHTWMHACIFETKVRMFNLCSAATKASSHNKMGQAGYTHISNK